MELITSPSKKTGFWTQIVAFKRRFLSDWARAIEYFVWGLGFAEAISFIFWATTGSDYAHWIIRMVLSPIFLYLYGVRYTRFVPTQQKENRRLGLLWFVLNVGFDLVVMVTIAGFDFSRVFLKSQPFLILGYIGVLVSPWIMDTKKHKQHKDDTWIGM